MILNQSKFSQAVNLSRAGVAKAVKNGAVILDENKKVDTENKVNKVYIYSDPKKKSAYFRYKKKFEDGNSSTKPKKTVKKSHDKQEAEDPKPTKREVVPPFDLGDSEKVNQVSMGEIAERKMIVSLQIEQEKYIKASTDNQVRINKLANRDMLQFLTERFLNHFITSIKRVSSTSLTDISKDILSNGKVENKHFAHFEDACLEMVHDSKVMLVKDMRRAEL